MARNSRNEGLKYKKTEVDYTIQNEYFPSKSNSRNTNNDLLSVNVPTNRKKLT